ncbi:hypothetical protein P170DRAFT_411341 [Aspergillus steynii IBT 23096]|uniref:Zn(2)-C6 fungal-type domain-containing protein n=1 Tax=Aspergillus steynii IBT 23096 TaxID=1392250 RepID=A0A2I2G6F9_9EURO|nr:uncharacterized protein P170DRAFT_411341 [Aspergillus steynii IBT 23096]PLB48464.1 hypothetical protein P170DRAFT_411341 [Aspergillus steynii IBT 23096]
MVPSARASNACETCRRRKVKCSGDKPCVSCVKHNWECNYGYVGRRRYSEAQVKHLLDKIRSYEEQLSSRSTAPQPSPLAAEQASTGLPQLGVTSSLENLEPYDESHDPLQCSDDLAGISPATDLTSGPAFESQVRSLLNRTHDDYSRHTFDRARGAGGEQFSERAFQDHATEICIPSMEESQQLLDQFLFYLGISQHFFDSRRFLDSLMLLYQSPEMREQQKRTMWYIEYLLVMAMAKLIYVDQPTSHIPGVDFFNEALRLLPPLHELGDHGVIAVEILTLIATYMQWCDRKHAAYLHIGLAIRLAIALGCNVHSSEPTCLPSQSAHKVRLWWTVYMLDRRLSSGLGLPAGADERQLRADLPRHSVGFQSPVALIINIRIARATDDIMSSLYGKLALTQLELVQKIQQILHELHDIGRSFPPALVFDFHRPLQHVSRTGSSLYLMLFQAIILCTRPILLQRVRLQTEQQQAGQSPDSTPTILVRLCNTCAEAAIRSLAILDCLRRQSIIPRYGFFDLDATFSAAFVLAMVGFLDRTQTSPPPSLLRAFRVLRFLYRAGNSAAERRSRDIQHTCSQVWPNYTFDPDSLDQEESPPGTAPGTRDQTRTPPPGPEPAHGPSSVRQPHYPPDGSNLSCPSQMEMNMLEPWAHSESMDAVFDMEEDWSLDLSGEAEGIHASFQNDTLPLTGVDYSDWLEIQKLLNSVDAV